MSRAGISGMGVISALLTLVNCPILKKHFKRSKSALVNTAS